MGRNSRGGALIEGMQSGQEGVFAFDNDEQYFPLFCLANPPDEVYDSLSLNVLPKQKTHEFLIRSTSTP